MMLKPVNQPRLSPASTDTSPRFQQYHYGPSSPHTSTIKSSRRISEPSPSPSLKPCPAPIPSRQVSYVSRGTQYSPMIQKMNDSLPGQSLPGIAAQPPLEKDKASEIVAPPPSLITHPISQTTSPVLKKRHSPDENISSVKSEESLPTKRVRPTETTVKTLPLKYELCEVEDMVILIANMISELIETNDGLPLRSSVLTRFHSR